MEMLERKHLAQREIRHRELQQPATGRTVGKPQQGVEPQHEAGGGFTKRYALDASLELLLLYKRR